MKIPILLTHFTLVFPLALSAQPPAEYFSQPEELSGTPEWKSDTQPLPPLEQIISLPPRKIPVYGIYIWGGEYENAHAEVQKMGVRSLRFSGPASEAEKALRIAARNGVEVMFTVSNATMRERKPGVRWNRSEYPSDETFLSAMEESFSGFLDRYGPGGTLFEGTDLESPVVAIEILNEPNFQYMIPDRQPREEVEAEREALYAKVLPRISTLVRDHPHTLPIVGFACGGGGATHADIRFVKGVYENAGETLHDRYDIFSTHPYMAGAAPEVYRIKPWGPIAISKNIKQMREFLQSQGGEKPIWFTEVGWEIGHEFGGKFPDNIRRKDEVLTEELHGAYMVRMYLWAMRLGVDRVHVMHMHDTDNFNSGLINRETFKWRPAAFAIRNIIDRMPNPQLTGAQSDGKNDSYIYEYTANHTMENSGKVIVAWNAGGPVVAAIEVEGAQVTVYDMVGNQKQLPVTEGKINLQIGPYPVYIESTPSP